MVQYHHHSDFLCDQLFQECIKTNLDGSLSTVHFLFKEISFRNILQDIQLESTNLSLVLLDEV